MNTADFAWLADQGPEFFEHYAGKCIAVRNGEVIGVGDRAPKCVEEAEKVASHGGFMLEGVDQETNPAGRAVPQLDSGAMNDYQTRMTLRTPEKSETWNAA